MAVGIGYDVHRLVAGRPLVLGGVTFDSEVGLLGHSDADVATHAIMDALLGAAALGDIGQHFPPSDPRFAGADSLALLHQVAALLTTHHWQIVNLDLTVIAERPRLGPRVPEMRERLARAAGLPPERVSVKATTNEGLGFLGRGDGIAALAVAELIRLRPSGAAAPPVTPTCACL
jgi:2-C-methyl-D-erythritol 2,4-cyclodiphosphate synthase